MPNPDNIGDVLRKERLKAGIQQKAVAADMGLSPGFLADVEKGRRNFTASQIDGYRESLVKLAAK